MVSPTPAECPLYSWATRIPGPVKPTHQERRAKREAGDTEQRTATPVTKPGHLRTLRVMEKKRGRDEVQVVTSRPTTPANREGKKPTPPFGVAPHQPAPHQCGVGRASAAAEPRGTGQNATVLARAPKQRPTPPPPRQGEGDDRRPLGDTYHRSRHTADQAKGVLAKRLGRSAPKGTLNPPRTPHRRAHDPGPSPRSPGTSWPMSRTARQSAS